MNLFIYILYTLYLYLYQSLNLGYKLTKCHCSPHQPFNNDDLNLKNQQHIKQNSCQLDKVQMCDNQMVNTSQIKKIKQLQNELNMYRHLANTRVSEVEGFRSEGMVQQRHHSFNSTSIVQPTLSVEASLTEQLTRLNSKLAEKNKEYEKLCQKYYRLELQNANLENNVSDLERERKFLADKLSELQIHAEGDEIIGELENKVVLMSTQIIRLGNLSRSKGQDLNDLKHRLREYEQKSRMLESKNFEKEQQISSYRERITALEQTVQTSSLNHIKYQNQSTYRILSEEIERLNVNLHNCFEENRVLEQKVRSTQKANIQLQERIQQRGSQEKQHYEYEIQQIRRKNMQLKKEISDLEDDNRKYKKEGKRNEEDLEQWRRKYHEIERQLKDQRQYSEVRYLNQLKDKQRQVEQSKGIISRYEEAAIEQKRKIDSLTFSIEQKAQQSFSIKRNFEGQIQKYQLDLKQMHQKCKIMDADLYKYEQKIVLLSQQIERLTIMAESGQRVIVQLNSKIETKDRDIKEKDFKLREKQNEMRTVQRSKESLKAELQQEKTQKQRIRSEMRQNFDKIRELQGQIFNQRSLNDEIDTLKTKLETKNVEYKSLEVRMNDLLLSKNKVRTDELEQKIKVQQQTFLVKKNELINHFEDKINLLQQNNSSLQQKLTSLASEHNETQGNYILLAQQIQRLNELLAGCNTELLKERRQVALLEENLHISELSLNKIKHSHIPSEKVQIQMKQRIQVYQRQLKNFQKENNHIKNKYNQLQMSQNYLEKQLKQAGDQKQVLAQRLNKKQEQLKERVNDFVMVKNNEANLIKYISEIKSANDRMERKIGEIEEDYIKRLSEKDKNLRESQSNIYGIEKQYRTLQSENNEKKYTIIRLHNRVELLQRQNEDIRQELNKKIAQIKEFEKQKSYTVENSVEIIRKEELQRYENKIIYLEQQLKKIHMALRQAQQIKKEQQNIIEDLGQQIQILRKEQIDHYNKQNIEAEQEREMKRIDFGQQTSASSSGGLDIRNNEIKQKYQILQNIHLRVKKDAEGLREKITEYEFKMKKLKGEFDLISRITHEYKDQSDYLRQNNHSQCIFIGRTLQNQAISNPSYQNTSKSHEENLIKQTLSAEIERLEILNGSLRGEVEDMRVYMGDNVKLKQRLDENMGLMVLLMAQIEALRNFKSHSS